VLFYSFDFHLKAAVLLAARLSPRVRRVIGLADDDNVMLDATLRKDRTRTMSFVPSSAQNSQGPSSIVADVAQLLEAVEGSIGDSASADGSDNIAATAPQNGYQPTSNGQAPSGNASSLPSFGSGSDCFSPQPSQGQSEMHGLGLILEGLGELLAGMSSSQGYGGSQGSGSKDPLFNSFQASDTGDPHLSFNGTMQNGAPNSGGGIQPQGQSGFPFGNAASGGGTQFASQNSSTPSNVSGKWDDMQGESDLLHADINGGRYQVSTDVTPPIDSNGTRLNKSVQVGFGQDSVRVDGSGNVTVAGKGGQETLAAGQSVTDPNNGFTVSRSKDGNSVTTTMQGPDGKDVSTTMQIHSEGYKGQQYVDITNMSGDHVRLGGAMVDHVAGADTQGASGANPGPTQPPQGDGNQALQNAVAGFLARTNDQQVAQLQPYQQPSHNDMNFNFEQLSFSEG